MSNDEIESDDETAESTADGTTVEAKDTNDQSAPVDTDTEQRGESIDETAEEEEEETDPESNSVSKVDFGPDEQSHPTERERQFAKMQRRLDEREMGLDSRSEELDERQTNLDEREDVLESRRVELDTREQKLDEREAALRQRADELDEREVELDEYETELNTQAERLTEQEETLHTYLDDQVEGLEGAIRDSVHSALEEYEDNRAPGRFGPTGTILVGLVGLTVAIAGVGYVITLSTGFGTPLLGSTVANLAIVAVLLIVGLALNLGAISNRI